MRVSSRCGSWSRADRDEVRAAEQDVGRLVDRIGEHQRARRRAAGGRDLRLDGRVARDLGHAHEAQERQQELVERLDRVWAKIVARAGVDPRGEVVGDLARDVVGQAACGRPVGERLVVGDQHEQLDARVLQPDAVLERAEVVADVQRAGRAVAGEDAEPRRIARDRGLEIVGAAAGVAQRRRGRVGGLGDGRDEGRHRI